MVTYTCGFDKQFFDMFKKHLSTKTNLQKRGLIIFDEISLRESVSINAKSLTYIGLIDVGDQT